MVLLASEACSLGQPARYNGHVQTTITIRDESAADREGIRRVHLQAFPSDAEARLVDQLRADGDLTISLVALVADEVVGHIAMSPVAIDGSPVGLGLAPVAVAPELQRSGVGSALVRRSLAFCRAEAVPLVVVLGEPAYYGRFGFIPAVALSLRDTFGGGDAFQAIVLAAEPPPRTGVVHYARAFSMFE
jgi:putative acetyltransferase